MHLTLSEFLDRFLAACGALTIIGGALTLLAKLFNPALRLRKDVVSLQQCNEDIAKQLQVIAETNKLLCKSMIELLDYTINGGGIEKIEDAKSELLNYLTAK